VDYQGLCSVCVLAPSCALPRQAARPIFSCEMFEERVEGAGEEGSGARGPQDDHRLTPGEEASAAPRGLCPTCERRFTCRLPRPEEGVWHCDEYL
jgi:ribosomal protein L37AE/L43A